jgi:hypothetical protein
MGPLWARSRITELSRGLYAGENEGLKQQITKLGLDHGLVTQYTSFVAVDEGGARFWEKPLLVPVESELPEGTRHEGFFGGGGKGGVAAAVRGMFGQAKSSGEVYSVGFGCREGGLGVLAGPKVKSASAIKNGVASRAEQFLAAPSRRLVRQLLSMQDRYGAFLEPGGDKAVVSDHALALLALAKAQSLYGAEVDEALRRAWTYLRDHTEGSGGKDTVTNALKGGPHFGKAGIRAELEAQSPVLAKLK